ncbi:type IVB secretion system protein IcmH/DotU [Paracoccus pacificus]|uniref:Type IVB secretion system protein IcmH/DotU n=1 Tax=Paracoccus pacificus TaxID=1463598 RepID=A0ABW4R6M4_9RHOB
MANRRDDKDKTVFGGPLPGASPAAPRPAAEGTESPFGPGSQGPIPQGGGNPAPGTPARHPNTAFPAPPASPPSGARTAGAAERTVIGAPMAPGAGPGWGAPQQPPPGQNPYPPAPGYGQGQGHYPQQPSTGNTWLGGPVTPQPPVGQGYGAQPPAPPSWGAPQYPPQYPPQGGGIGTPHYPPSAYPPGQGGYAPPVYSPQGNIGQAAPTDRGFFPDIPRGDAAVAPMQGPKIPLAQALQVKPLDKGASSNPLVAAAAGLLILFGRLRTGLVEMQAAPLMDHVTRELDKFERNALLLGADPHEAMVGKYILSGTADDIVQNLPGADRGDWLQYSMVARFFHRRDSGVGFFQETEKAMQAPAQRYNLLELILTCLSLGFEGQYRTMPNGGVELSRIRTAIYETLRRVHPRPDEDISVAWTPVVMGDRRRFGFVSVPMVLGGAAITLLAAFAILTTVINRDGAAAAEALLRLHPGDVKIAIERAPGPVFEAEIPQLERIRGAFADDIKNGAMSVDQKGDYITIRVGNLQLFDTASVTLKDGFAPMAERITKVLNDEGGPVLIQGYTDNVPMSGRGQYKTNEQLSLARAEAMQAELAKTIDDPARIAVEGKGPADPIADNATEDGRAQNRRVEVMLRREGTY